MAKYKINFDFYQEVLGGFIRLRIQIPNSNLAVLKKISNFDQGNQYPQVVSNNGKYYSQAAGASRIILF